MHVEILKNSSFSIKAKFNNMKIDLPKNCNNIELKKKDLQQTKSKRICFKFECLEYHEYINICVYVCKTMSGFYESIDIIFCSIRV